jgi:hypothetical protein
VQETRLAWSVARLGVDEDRPDLVTEPGLGPGLARPPAQRRVRNERDPLARPDWSQAASQRRAALRFGQQLRRVARVVSVEKLADHVCRDCPHGECGV